MSTADWAVPAPAPIEIDAGGRVHIFKPDAPVVIGRSPDAQIVLDAATISSRHLRLEAVAGGWTATDLSSTNGTFVDGVDFRTGTVGPVWTVLLLGDPVDGVPVRVRAAATWPSMATVARPGSAARPPDAVLVVDGTAVLQRPAPASALSPPSWFAPPNDTQVLDAATAPVAAVPLEAPAAPAPWARPVLPHLTVHGADGGGAGRVWGTRRALRDAQVVRSVLIGRGDDCDIPLGDLLVSRHHARLEYLDDATARVVDLGSVNGTFVDRRLAQPAIQVVEGSLVSIGNAEFEFRRGELRPASAVADRASAAGFAVLGLCVPDRLDNVSFALAPGTFLAVLGTSGAGKSTLLKAITGVEPATAGSVRFDDRDLYANFRALRHRIGYVPQDDILHDQLTVDESLGFGAELRFPDASPEARQARIDEVIADLLLEPHRGKLVRQLSGGQRKRVSVGLELLHRPSLLILDEPTSGLDPGNERRLMTQLAALASDGTGRNVLVVTHSTESLHLCDQVLFLAKGGVTIYMGAPAHAAATLGADDFPAAFVAAEETDRPDLMRERFLATPLGQPIRELQALAVPQPAAAPASVRTANAKSTFSRDLRIFVRRYTRLLVADRRALLTIALQAPIIALLVAVTATPGALDPSNHVPGGGNVLMALVLGSIYAGASNAAREVVKERSILRREQNFGISLAAYLLSKMIVLSCVSVLQAVVFVVIGTSRQGDLGRGSWFADAQVELFFVVALSGISAVALGLLLSCMVSSSDKASGVLPMILLAQFVLAGLSFGVDKLGVEQVSWLMSARWGFAAAASTVDYVGLGGCHQADVPGAIGPACLGSWDHGVGVWIGDMFMLAFLTVLFLGSAWVVLARADPANQLGDDEPDLPEWKRILGIRA